MTELLDEIDASRKKEATARVDSTAWLYDTGNMVSGDVTLWQSDKARAFHLLLTQSMCSSSHVHASPLYGTSFGCVDFKRMD